MIKAVPVLKFQQEVWAWQKQRLDLDGTIALMDALHTQVGTARSIVQEGGGDFVRVAKGNQGTLRDPCENLLPEDFSPSALNGHRKILACGVPLFLHIRGR